jgi:hypothetical protein
MKVSSARGGEVLCVERREGVSYYLTMLALTAPGAAIVWFVFRGVYENLRPAERAAGYVDPMMQTGILLGYCAMVGGSLALGCAAAWSAIQLIRLLVKRGP